MGNGNGAEGSAGRLMEAAEVGPGDPPLSRSRLRPARPRRVERQPSRLPLSVDARISRSAATAATPACRPASRARSIWWNSSRPTPLVSGITVTVAEGDALESERRSPICMMRMSVSPSEGARVALGRVEALPI